MDYRRIYKKSKSCTSYELISIVHDKDKRWRSLGVVHQITRDILPECEVDSGICTERPAVLIAAHQGENKQDAVVGCVSRRYIYVWRTNDTTMICWEND